jgi:integrase
MVERKPREEWRNPVIYKRGGVYWYGFMFKGERVQKSTHQGNANRARDMEAKERSRLADGEAGMKPRKAIPTLADFEQRFLDEIRVRRADHPETIQFYESKYSGLLRYKPMAQARLDHIDEQLISQFTAKMVNDDPQRKPRVFEKSTVNRHLATLKRALRLAAKWRLIDRVPSIELLTGENEREFVLSREQQPEYLEVCPEFLRQWAGFALETGMRRKEIVSLKWPDVHFEPSGNARCGYVHVRGTKSKTSKRDIPLTVTAQMILQQQKQISECEYVFVSDQDHTNPASISAVSHCHERVRELLPDLPKEFVLHSLRHTFATRLGESGASAFAIMRLMGHSLITISQRYVHSGRATMENAVLEMEQADTKFLENRSGVTTIFTTPDQPLEKAATEKIQ